MATVVWVLVVTSPRLSMPSAAEVMGASVRSGVISEIESTKVVLPAANPPAMTILSGRVVEVASVLLLPVRGCGGHGKPSRGWTNQGRSRRRVLRRWSPVPPAEGPRRAPGQSPGARRGARQSRRSTAENTQRSRRSSCSGGSPLVLRPGTAVISESRGSGPVAAWVRPFTMANWRTNLLGGSVLICCQDSVRGRSGPR